MNRTLKDNTFDKKAVDKLIQKDFPNHNVNELADNIKKDWIRTHQPLDDYVYSWKDLAKLELERRGDTLPQVEISGHAIDKASLRVWKHWREQNEHARRFAKGAGNKDWKPLGFYSWLSAVTLTALEKGEFKNDKYHYLGMKLVIEEGNEYPLLKTIMI